MTLNLRRDFIKKAALATVGTIMAPAFINPFELKAESSFRKTKHILLFVLGDGVRNEEALYSQEKNIMPHVFGRNSSLATKGTLFNNFCFTGEEVNHSSAVYRLLSGKVQKTHITDSVVNNKEIESEIKNVFIDFQTKKKSLYIIESYGADSAHFSYELYIDYLKTVDRSLKFVFDQIQLDSQLKDNTLLIVASAHGRNNYHNDVVDYSGLGGLDHYHESARKTFCLIAGTESLVPQNKIVSEEINTTALMPAITELLYMGASLPSAITENGFLQKSIVPST